MDFSEAAIMHLQAHDAGDAFAHACSERESTIKAEMDSMVQVFRGVLEGDANVYALSNGGYLYLKSNTTTRGVNASRIETAVTDLTVGQLQRVADQIRVNSSRQPTLGEVLHDAIQENLEDECITVNRRPEIALRRPKGVDSNVGRAPESIDRVALQYVGLKTRLGELRKQRTRGKKRCLDVVQMTEPVIREYMRNNWVQRVRLLPEAAAAASPPSSATPDTPDTALDPLPELPVLLPQHKMEARDVARNVAKANSGAAAPMVDIAASLAAERTIEFRKRTYTSRGKMPKLTEYTKRIAKALSKLPATVSESAIKKLLGSEGRRQIAEVLLDELNAMVSVTKGKTTEKLKIKVL